MAHSRIDNVQHLEPTSAENAGQRLLDRRAITSHDGLIIDELQIMAVLFKSVKIQESFWMLALLPSVKPGPSEAFAMMQAISDPVASGLHSLAGLGI